jgi:hypothetical protein
MVENPSKSDRAHFPIRTTRKCSGAMKPENPFGSQLSFDGTSGTISGSSYRSFIG